MYRGESKFTEAILSELIAQAEEKCNTLTEQISSIEEEINNSNRYINELSATYDELISWADLYESAEFEKKKMIVNSLIQRVEVFSGYKIKVDFTFDIGQFLNGIDSEV